MYRLSLHPCAAQLRAAATLLAALVALAAPSAAWAQAYPTKTVRLIVPFAPGGTTDIVARIVAPGMAAALGQQVVVENKAGGGGSIGALEMIKAPPDGHVLGMATVSTTAANPPNVPTFREVGLEPVNRMAYYGVLAPKGTPREVVDKAGQAVAKALADASVRKRIEDTGSLIIGNTPEQFAAQIKAELEVYKGVVIKQKLTLE